MPYDSSDQINVSLDSLRTASNALHQASQSISHLLAQLDSGSSHLQGAMSSALWLSPQALAELQNRWNDALTHLSGALQTMGDDLLTAADSYETVDQKAGQELRPGS